MITKRFFLFLLAALLYSTSTLAGRVELVQMEHHIETRIKNAIASLDPNAQVFAKINLRKQKKPLTGTDLSLLNISLNYEYKAIDFTDLANIDIKILTALPAIPQIYLDEIKRTFEYTDVPLKLAVETMDAETLAALKAREIKQVALSKTELLRMTFIAAVAALALIILVSNIILGRTFKVSLTEGSSKVSLAISESQLNKSLSSQSPEETTAQRNSSLSQQDEKSLSDNLIMMSGEQIVAIISDCYWCQKDAYASWLWQEMSVLQRSDLLKKWPKAEAYSKYLTYVTPSPEMYHNHPTYLKPLPIENLDQTDLQKVLEKQPGVWNHLSAIRQENSLLSLQEQLKFMNSQPIEFEKINVPKQSSPDRALKQKANFSAITLADELALWENPDMVPEQYRNEIPTLVWLARLEKGEIEGVLQKLNADQIAQAWIGPEPVLDVIKQALPEKKLNLLESYAKKIEASRKSGPFQYLVQQSQLIGAAKNATDSHQIKETDEEAGNVKKSA